MAAVAPPREREKEKRNESLQFDELRRLTAKIPKFPPVICLHVRANSLNAQNVNFCVILRGECSPFAKIIMKKTQIHLRLIPNKHFERAAPGMPGEKNENSCSFQIMISHTRGHRLLYTRQFARVHRKRVDVDDDVLTV